MAKLAPIFNDAQLISGIPATGAKLFTYVAGSTTKQNTYTDESGLTAQANPIILNARGEPASPIWLTEGLTYKFVFSPSTDTDPPASPIRTVDNVSGVNDSSITIDQWIASGVTPTYTSATTFTLSGDQTSAFHVGRRVKLLVTAGTVYGTVTIAAYAALTTITVVLDSGVLDTGLSVASLGLITSTNTSAPILPDSNFYVSGSTDKTKLIKFEVDGLTTATTRVITFPDKDLTLDNTKLQSITSTASAGALTLTVNPTALDFRSATLPTGTPTTTAIASASMVVPSGTNLGSVSAQTTRLIEVVLSNGEVAVQNINGLNNLDEMNVITTEAIAQQSTFFGTIAVTTGILTQTAGVVTGTVAIGQEISGAGITQGTYLIKYIGGGTGIGTVGATYQTNQIVATGAGIAITGKAGMGIYSTTARTGLAYRVVGSVDAVNTAGSWASPTLVQGAGGIALSNLGSLGVGQVYKDLLGSRSFSTVYYNPNNKPMGLHVRAYATSANHVIQVTLANGQILSSAIQSVANASAQISVIIPPLSSYKVAQTGTAPVIVDWNELS